MQVVHSEVGKEVAAAEQAGGSGQQAAAASCCTAALAAAGGPDVLDREGVSVAEVLAVGQPLAAALLEWWQRPEGLAQQRNDQALTAAARSCANLQCDNVALEGGPRAGRGAGCKRCRWAAGLEGCGVKSQRLDC